MDYTITEYTHYHANEILALYRAVEWSNYTNSPEMLQSAYQNSLYILAAYDTQKQLIGIIRAVGDGHSIVYIQDIIVHPSVQRKGIGTTLLNRVIEHYKHVYQIILTTDNTEKTVQFYQSVGFRSLADLSCCSFMYMPATQ